MGSDDKTSNRSRKVTIRLTIAEFDKLERKYKRTTCRKMSEYIRSALLNKPVTVYFRNKSADAFLAEMLQLRNELNAIGNNYNQSVKRLHTMDRVPEIKAWLFLNEQDKNDFFNKLDDVQVKMKQIHEQWSQESPPPHSMRRALSYNELKMKLGQAECLEAGNYLAEAQQLNFYEKLERFQSLTQLNERTKRNTLHISLNFDPKENFEKEKLRELAKVYMEKIGFGNQPYLVYKHLDAGHPHIHILTTNIQPDGRAISMHNLGRNQSEEARKSIELQYNLVRAESRRQQQKQEITKKFREVHVQRMQYGKYETKRSLTNVLNHVLNQYKYTSLPELNAVLRLYNVLADRGEEGSRIRRKRGLVHRILDQNGK